MQLAYTPHVASLLTSTFETSPDTRDILYELAENIPLYLPSSLPPQIRNLPELEEIRDQEHCLREAQADDALAHIRQQRRVIQGMWQFKRVNISGTGNRPNTCMITLYKSLQSKVQ